MVRVTGRQRTWRGGKYASDVPSQLLDLEGRRWSNSKGPGLDACKDSVAFTRNRAAKRKSGFGEKIVNLAVNETTRGYLGGGRFFFSFVFRRYN